MTDNKIVELFPSPHTACPVVCGECKHEWVGVIPVGMTRVECPECKTLKGHLKWAYGPTGDDLSYQCGCGSSDFFIMKLRGKHPAAVYCRGCGKQSTGWFE